MDCVVREKDTEFVLYRSLKRGDVFLFSGYPDGQPLMKIKCGHVNLVNGLSTAPRSEQLLADEPVILLSQITPAEFEVQK